jgi:riboflavin kinase/FMN adenylyltransferase
MVSGHVIHGRKLGRTLGESSTSKHDGFRTLNIAFRHTQPALKGIIIARVHGLSPEPLSAIASLGTRPAVENNGHVLLEVHCLDWPLELEAAYGQLVQIELLHKLHDERPYPSLEQLTQGIAQDIEDAKAWWRTMAP